MEKTIALMFPAVMLALAATGCVDDKYDLSDIDTTVRVNVNDLVIPVNIDQIQLKSIIDIDESDPDNHIKLVDGAYAYVQSGTFHTGAITVAEVVVESPNTPKIEIETPVAVPALPGVTLPDIDVTIPQAMTDYKFTAKNISEHICTLSGVTAVCEVKVNIHTEGLETVIDGFSLADFRLLLPTSLIVKSVAGAEYDAETHNLVINSPMSVSGVQITLAASGLDLPDGAFSEAENSLTLEGNVGVEGGKMTIRPRSNLSEAASGNLSLLVEYEFSPMHVTAIDGDIKYDITDVVVPDINITDLPDVLAQSGTNLVLTNPCLYLGVNNPLSVCNLSAQTGFDITSYHGDKQAVYSIDDAYFTISGAERSNYCFSPKMPASVDAGYSGCTHVGFRSLSNVLSGDGLPDRLTVDLVNPQVPRQHVQGFMLGHDYGSVDGDYKFVAPLQFDDGTHITYSDKIDGWSSDDLDKMTVQRLDVNLTITTDVPVGIEFTGYPIDKNGRRINNVQINGAHIDANANAQKVKISVSGEFSNLDGIEFEAKASAVGGGAALNPDMTIKLTDIRPCVAGYYQTEL